MYRGVRFEGKFVMMKMARLCSFAVAEQYENVSVRVAESDEMSKL